MAGNKLEARQEKAKEKFEEKAKKKKEEKLEEAGAVVEEKEKKEKPKKKAEIKKPVVDHARAYIEYSPISSKTSVEVARAIRGKTIKKANTLLDEVIKMQKPIRYYRFNKDTPHRKGKGFGAGRYPIKIAKIFKDLILNAVANATYLNLDPEKLYIKSVIANRAISKERQGRYTNVTLTVAEAQEEKRKSTRAAKQSKPKAEVKA